MRSHVIVLAEPLIDCDLCLPGGLVCADRTALIPVSHRLPPRGYDEPESLSYAITSICPVSADGEQAPRRY